MGELFKSRIAEHSWDEDHRKQWNMTEIIHKEENRIIRKLKEQADRPLTQHRRKVHMALSTAE
jgi:hypothetical protein